MAMMSCVSHITACDFLEHYGLQDIRTKELNHMENQIYIVRRPNNVLLVNLQYVKEMTRLLKYFCKPSNTSGIGRSEKQHFLNFGVFDYRPTYCKSPQTRQDCEDIP